METCKNYVGVACVDGTCPLCNKDDERVPSIEVCDNCWYNAGCDDCALYGTPYCIGHERKFKFPGEPEEG